jgi:regulator of protease activity HflC (stomatin/prohibitin superfamily)
MIKSAVSCLALVVVALGASGCATATVEPGHRGLYFAPYDGGLKRDLLQPGKYRLGWCFLYCTPNRVDDFDVTYSTRQEEIDTKSSEGLNLHLKLSVIYRPIVSELYQLDTEIGPNYYDEVIGPEFRSACRGVLARHSYTELQKRNEAIEDEVEAEVRRRTAGKHVEISSVTLESVDYAPEIAQKIREKIAGEQEAARQQAVIAAEHAKKMAVMNAEDEQREREIAIARAQKQAEIEAEAAEKKLRLEKETEEQRFKVEQELAALEARKKAARAELEVKKLEAQADAASKIIAAKADAEAEKQLASAKAADARAATAGITPMEVMEHAYDALGRLGGTGTTIVLGDWAHVPSFLFPRVPSLQSGFMLPYPYLSPPAAAPSPSASAGASGSSILSSTARP